MQRIHLTKGIWEFDVEKPLGPPGGFGEVFSGSGRSGESVAVKRLHTKVVAYGSRELKIADFLLGHNYPHVIPIMDAGLDLETGRNFIVMARADQSLQELIERSAPLQENETLEIIDAIASGLAEIEALVHRDLKPGNVLSHNGVWKLADLGLARFVEASTSLNTMKGFLSPPYAAPELWRIEHATKATDVYSLGCIIYALMTCEPPFPGPTEADYSHQHQSEKPPALAASSRLRQIAYSCLAKNQSVRPSISSVRAQIRRAREAAGSVLRNPLVDAAAAIAEERSAKEAEERLREKIEQDRKLTAAEAVSNLQEIFVALIEAIMADAPAAEKLVGVNSYFPGDERLGVKHDSGWMGVKLGEGYLICGFQYPYLDAAKFAQPGWDVTAGAMIEIGNTGMHFPEQPSRSANLWFAKLPDQEGYRWWEMGFMHSESALRDNSGDFIQKTMEPFAIGSGHFNSGFRIGIEGIGGGYYRLAYNPRPVDREFVEDFYSRWTAWLAQAALGKLRKPAKLPEEEIISAYVIGKQSIWGIAPL